MRTDWPAKLANLNDPMLFLAMTILAMLPYVAEDITARRILELSSCSSVSLLTTNKMKKKIEAIHSKVLASDQVLALIEANRMLYFSPAENAFFDSPMT